MQAGTVKTWHSTLPLTPSTDTPLLTAFKALTQVVMRREKPQPQPLAQHPTILPEPSWEATPGKSSCQFLQPFHNCTNFALLQQEPATFSSRHRHTPKAACNLSSSQTTNEWVSQTLRQPCSRENPESAMCVQSFDDSRGLAIRITYRISLRSSSLWEPRHPSLKVVKDIVIFPTWLGLPHVQ